MAREKDSYSIQSVECALSLLEVLGEEGEELRLSRLSERLDMSKARVFRLLATFEQRGYIERIGTSGSYRLGLPVFEMGQKFLQRMSLLRHAKPVMERLARQCNEAVYLVVPDCEEVLFLDMVDSGQQIAAIPLIGRRYPIGGTSSGGAILDGRTFGLGNRNEIPWHADHGSLEEDISSLSVPLLSGSKTVPGSLSIVGPDFRFDQERLVRELLPLLQEAACIVSSRLGYVRH